MIEFNQYVGRMNGLRGSFGGLPPWARSVVGLFAVPGLLIMALSAILFLVSILALLLLTLPVYSLLSRLTGSPLGVSVGRGSGSGVTIASPFGATMPFGFSPAGLGPSGAGTKRVDSTIVDPD